MCDLYLNLHTTFKNISLNCAYYKRFPWFYVYNKSMELLFEEINHKDKLVQEKKRHHLSVIIGGFKINLNKTNIF